MTDSLVVSELPELFARYLKATTGDERHALAREHPHAFPPEIVAALADAREQISASLKDAQDACRLIDGVAAAMDLPANGSELVKVQESEKRLLVDEALIVDRFAQTLTQLLPQMPPTASGDKPTGIAAPTVAAAPSSSSAVLTKCSTGEGTAATDCAVGEESTNARSRLWYEQPTLVFEILSYLPTEDVLSSAETVCRKWYLWLCVPATSRFFWVGCVQREYPRLLQQLIRTEGGDLFESDWRTIALLCVAEAAEEDDTGASPDGA